MIYFIIWIAFSFIWILIFPIEYMINKMDDEVLLKKWWRKHVVGIDPEQRSDNNK